MGLNKSKSAVEPSLTSKHRLQLLDAVSKGQLSRVRHLSNFRSLLHSSDKNGCNALHLAVQFGKLDLVRCLMKAGIDVNRKDDCQMTALHYAATRGYFTIVEEILQNRTLVLRDERDTWGWTPLHRSVINHHEDIAILLLKHGSNVNVADENKRVALHVAAADGQLQLVQQLLSRGANVDWQDTRSRTPLYLAVVGRQKEVIKTLIAHGCDIELATMGGLTPLYHAIKKGMTDIVELLVTAGARALPQAGFPNNGDYPTLVHLVTLGAGNNGNNKKAEHFLQIAVMLVEQDGRPSPVEALQVILNHLTDNHPHYDLLVDLIRLLLLSGNKTSFHIPPSLPMKIKLDLEEWCQGHLHPNAPPLLELCRRTIRHYLHENYQNVTYAANLLYIPNFLKEIILLRA